ncbi:MAG: paraquat-inducible membrane protein A, partial [Gammaproteobacteria bacterium]
SIQVHAGLYIFAAAVILIMLITQQVVKYAE